MCIRDRWYLSEKRWCSSNGDIEAMPCNFSAADLIAFTVGKYVFCRSFIAFYASVFITFMSVIACLSVFPIASIEWFLIDWFTAIKVALSTVVDAEE